MAIRIPLLAEKAYAPIRVDSLLSQLLNLPLTSDGFLPTDTDMLSEDIKPLVNDRARVSRITGGVKL